MLKLVVNNPWGKVERLQAEYMEIVMSVTEGILDAQDKFDEWMAAVDEHHQAQLIEKLCNEGRA